MATKGDGVRMANDAIRSYSQQAESYQQERHQLQVQLREIGEELIETLGHISQALIRSIEKEDVEKVVEETGAMQLYTLLDELEAEKSNKKQRITEIENLDEYQQRELLNHPQTGEYTIKIEEMQNNINALLPAYQKFEDKDFQWLYKRGIHLGAEKKGVKKFWRWVTLADYREERIKNKLLDLWHKSEDEKGYEDWVGQYEELKSNIELFTKEQNDWQKKSDTLAALVDEHDSSANWVDNYELEAKKALQSCLADHLQDIDYEVLHKQVRSSGKILAAKCHALTEKQKYLKNMIHYLANEINDRQKRIDSIDRVRRKWARKPYGYMRGDKTKWLCTIPRMKSEGCRKRIRWVSTMRTNVYHYDNYDAYNCYMAAEMSFLAYDAFAYRAEERMPYEGFTRSVIPELDEYREDHQLEGPDYSEFAESLEEYDPEEYEEMLSEEMDAEEEAYDEEMESEEGYEDEMEAEDALMDEDDMSMDEES